MNTHHHQLQIQQHVQMLQNACLNLPNLNFCLKVPGGSSANDSRTTAGCGAIEAEIHRRAIMLSSVLSSTAALAPPPPPPPRNQNGQAGRASTANGQPAHLTQGAAKEQAEAHINNEEFRARQPVKKEQNTCDGTLDASTQILTKKRGWRKCKTCNQTHHWNTKCLSPKWYVHPEICSLGCSFCILSRSCRHCWLLFMILCPEKMSQRAHDSSAKRSSFPPTLSAASPGWHKTVATAPSGLDAGVARHQCKLCGRMFKSAHAVDIHMSRNDECRRRKAASNGKTGFDRLRSAHTVTYQAFKTGKTVKKKPWSHRSGCDTGKHEPLLAINPADRVQDSSVALGGVSSHVVRGNSTVSAQANKTSHADASSAHVPGKESVRYRGQLIDVLATKANATACAPTSNKCLLCARKFISKHALRIHLTRNAKCRRQVSSRATWH